MARSFVGPNADAELATLSGASEIICSSVRSPFVALARNGDEEVAVSASRRAELRWLSCASSWSTRSAHPYNMVDVETAIIKIQGALGPWSLRKWRALLRLLRRDDILVMSEYAGREVRRTVSILSLLLQLVSSPPRCAMTMLERRVAVGDVRTNAGTLVTGWGRTG